MKDTSTWFNKYMELAKHAASWSKDPSRKIGAVAVGKHGQILSTGYNGFPRGIRDNKRLNDRQMKYKLVVHAEQNCIYNATLNGVCLDGADLYVYGLPVCNECAKGVIQVGIRNVYMCHEVDLDDKWKESYETTKSMFNEVDMEYWTFSEENGKYKIIDGSSRGYKPLTLTESWD